VGSGCQAFSLKTIPGPVGKPRALPWAWSCQAFSLKTIPGPVGKPRALPWAESCQAFGLKTNPGSVANPRALPWAEGSQAFGLKANAGPADDDGIAASHGFASMIKLNGVLVAVRKRLKPAEVTTSRSRFSPAWAPSPKPTSWLSDAGTQSIVDAA
jgi:hypothetical protein